MLTFDVWFLLLIGIKSKWLELNLFTFLFCSHYFFVQSGDQPNPAPAGQVDYTKAWEEYYKKMGMFYLLLIFKFYFSETLLIHTQFYFEKTKLLL